MIVLNDLCGDEDDAYLWWKYAEVLIQEHLYQQLLNLKTNEPTTYTYRLPGVVHCVSITGEIV